jgi:hypothetical protein
LSSIFSVFEQPGDTGKMLFKFDIRHRYFWVRVNFSPTLSASK